VSLGLAELDRWLGDQVRVGLAGLRRAGYAYIDAVAARMVDAQAPGVAGMLRSIPGELVHEDWPERVLHAFGAVRLLIRAHEQLDRLPLDLAATVRSRIGYPVHTDDVWSSPGVADRWHAVGAVDTVDDQLQRRRVWLLGERTRRWAVWLAFAPPGRTLDSSVQPGQVIEAEVHFYPGSGQHRVLVGADHDLSPVPFAPRGTCLAVVREQFAGLLAADPWASRSPAVVRAAVVPPDRPGGVWLLADSAGEVCVLEPTALDPWTLLAYSCGAEVAIVGEWHGDRLLPLGVLPESEPIPTGVASG
jgi:hypothetical protein